MLRGKQKYTSIYILTFILFSIFSPIFINTESISMEIAEDTNLDKQTIDHLHSESNSDKLEQNYYVNLDKEKNGISDIFEIRLKELAEVGFIEDVLDHYDPALPDKAIIDFPIKEGKANTIRITKEDIPIIVSFPYEDYKFASSLFKELGGIIEHEYTVALNGFAGRIDLTALNKFCEILRKSKEPFLIEEDRIYHADLYYTSRNMNLRPYVWNDLPYKGDDYSSIAIIDTGIDESHNLFIPGYSDGDPSYKIVGWQDEINFLGSPYDDNGHGSHCGGIAAGIGGPNYDGNGRSVATASYSYDYTGYDITEGEYEFDWTRFRVDTTGVIEMNCEFDDFTPGSDDCDFWAYLYHGDTLVASYVDNSDSWSHTLTYTVTSGGLGDYSFRFVINLVDNTGDGYCSDFYMRFRNVIHWPFDPPLYLSGDAWQGIAPDANLVGIKVLDEHGSGYSSDIINGINWAIANRMVYNITTISISLGGPSGDTNFITAVNNAVENGIVTVVSAGNSGPGDNYIGSPGDADNVITVAATSIDDEITDYSSQGGDSYTGFTIKPDICAPGGSFYNIQMFSADANDNDADGIYPTDGYANDLYGAQGTSMSAPAVAGASNLVIDAMGGHQIWGYTAEEAKRVKALLLMSATETYPLLREYYTGSSPLLNRGGKDVHEGYGRINVDAAIEAFTQELTLGSDTTAYISSSSIDPIDKHALGCYVDLVVGETYIFTLDVPSGADFDLHLYSNTPSPIGEPIMVAKSISTNLGEDEVLAWTANVTGKYYLIAKAISGEGDAVISYPILDHDLHVSLEVPDNPVLYGSYTINATVLNNGLYAESNVDLYFYVDSVLVDSTSISTLNVDQEITINYPWSPTRYKSYNFTAYAPSLTGETIIVNNYVEKFAEFPAPLNYTMTVGAPYTWIDATGGTELFLGDDSYAAIVLPFDFQFYDTTFSTIYLASNGYLSFVDTSPTDFTNDPIPSATVDHHYLIAPFWDDLDPGGSGIYVESFGSYWVAEWLNIYHYDGSIVGTFEVIIYESGEIVFNYDYLDYTAGGYTCGLNFGVDTSYYNVYQNLNSLTDDFTLLFSPWYASLEHDLTVSLEIPTFAEPNNNYIVTATVTNMGIYAESDVDLFLYINDILVDSTTTSSLLVGETETINYIWTPTTYGDYTFKASTPWLPIEPYIDNNEIEKTLPIKEIKIFNGMFLDYVFLLFDTVYIWESLYSEVSQRFFHNDYSLYFEGFLDQTGYWDVDSLTRIMSNSYGGVSFGSGTHTPLWIFTDISIGEIISIAVDTEGDHDFYVAGDSFYEVPGLGFVEVWELEDLTLPGGFAWYEKSTGILLGGTFLYNYGAYYYAFNILDTNAPFDYYDLTIISPDSTNSWGIDTSQSITWTSTGSISDVKIELYLDGVFEMQIVASTPNDGSYDWTIPTTLVDSTLYQIKISDVANPIIDDFSDNFEIKSPPEVPAIPGYILHILIGTICVVSVILLKKRFKLIK
ncbi:MAG: S8 family serine peptidase [Promethearchaeota archaeon]